MKELDPNRLLFLLTVVRAGSISAGARALGWTQQGISRHLRELEHQVGAPLLLRHNRGVQPTDVARALLAHAEAIADHLAAAQADVEEFAQLQRGTVRLAAYATAMAALIPQAMAVLDPGVTVQLVTADPTSALDLLRRSRVDVAVVFRFADDPAGDREAWTEVEIGRETYRVIAWADHPVIGRPNLRLADLADETWVVGCEHCQRHLVASARAAGFTPQISQQTNDHLVAEAFVVQGLALTILPQTALVAFPDARLVASAFPELEERAVVACHRPGADQVPSVAAVLAALRQAA